MNLMPQLKKIISGAVAPLALCLALTGCLAIFPLADPTTSSSKETLATTTGTTEVTTTTTEETTRSPETSGTTSETTTSETTEVTTTTTESQALPEDGEYTSKEDVALYIHLYGHLPSNFITKKEAKALGWEGGSLEPYAPGRSIGGDRFGNYEGNLPDEHEPYRECDIGTKGKKSRGAKRIVFSDDGYIYYTDDHYNTFTLLYPEK